MSQPVRTVPVELPLSDWRLVEAALRSFLSDFGHDEAEVIDQIRAVLAKLPAVPATEPVR